MREELGEECVCGGFEGCEVDGLRCCELLVRIVTDRGEGKRQTLRIANVHASFAIHHAYARATFLSRVDEIPPPPLPTSNFLPPSSSSRRFLSTSAPPTFVSPRSRRKSHKQNWSVIL